MQFSSCKTTIRSTISTKSLYKICSSYGVVVVGIGAVVEGGGGDGAGPNTRSISSSEARIPNTTRNPPWLE